MRSFIAIELPDSARSALADLQQQLKKSRCDIRWVKPENIHLTLKFLGEIEENSVAAIVEAIKGTCSSVATFSLTMKGLGLFPDQKSPRVIWAGISGSSSSVAGIQQGIETGLASLGFKPEKRTYAPHVTLGRFRSFRGSKSLLDLVDQFKDTCYGTFTVGSISLMRSDLNPGGATYRRIAGIKLTGNQLANDG